MLIMQHRSPRIICFSPIAFVKFINEKILSRKNGLIFLFVLDWYFSFLNFALQCVSHLLLQNRVVRVKLHNLKKDILWKILIDSFSFCAIVSEAVTYKLGPVRAYIQTFPEVFSKSAHKFFQSFQINQGLLNTKNSLFRKNLYLPNGGQKRDKMG